MRWIILLLISIFIFNASYLGATTPTENRQISQTKQKLTSISGKLVNQEAINYIGLQFYKDYISYEQEYFKVPIDFTQEFSMNFQLMEPTIVLFSYGLEEIELYVEPGDELLLEFDGKNFLNSLAFSGNGAVHNRFLKRYHKQFKNWNDAFIDYEIATKSSWEFRRFMGNIHSSKWNYLRNYPEKRSFSKDFLQYVYADIDYWWAYHLMRYRVENIASKKVEEISYNYFDFLEQILISNDKALINKNYLYFLDQYLLFRNNSDVLDEVKSLEEKRMVVVAPNMIIMARPDREPILGQALKDDYLKYLNQKSDFQSPTMINNRIKEEHWYKVRTTAGEVGWVLGGGVQFENIIRPKYKLKKHFENYATSKYKNVGSYLHGKTLFYTIATDLYWRSHIETAAALKEQTELFLKYNPINEFQATVNAAYQIARLNSLTAGEEVNLVSEYRIMNDPIIRSKKEPVVEITPDAQALKDIFAMTPFKVFGERNEMPILMDKSIKYEINRLAMLEAEANKVVESEDKELKEELVKEATIAAVTKPVKADKKEAITKSEKVTTDKLQVSKTSIPATPKTTIAKTKTPDQNFVEIDNQPYELSTSSTFIGGKVKTISSLEMNMKIFVEPILFQEVNHTLKLDGKSEVKLDFELGQTSIGELSYNKKTYQLYIEPGDQLNFQYSAADFPNLFFTGKGAEHNNYQVAKAHKFEELAEQLKDKIKDANPSEFLTFMRAARNNQLQFLNNFPDKKAFSKAFFAYAKADIDYWYGFNLLNYPWEHPLHHNLDAPMEVTKDYYDFFRELPAYTEYALPNMNYTYYLDQFFDHQMEQYENTDLSEIQIAEKYLQGDVLHYYKAKLLSIACKRGKAAKVGPEIVNFLAECPNEAYNNVLRQVYNEAKGLTIGSKAPDFALKDINGKTVKLSEYQGKIVYLDFWATWCSPCIHHMNNSRSWKKEYKDKGVIFLYVSLDEDENAWNQFVKSQKLEGLHVLASNGDVYQSQIAKLYKVKRMPAVFLVDKNGRISYNSTKAGSGRVVDQIDRMMMDN